MLDPFSVAGAFLTGLFGSVHCVAMCGSIVTGLNQSSHSQGELNSIIVESNSEQNSTCTNKAVSQHWKHTLLYHLGRISSYMLAGFIISGLGILGYQSMEYSNAILVGQIVAATFMFLLGLYISKIWQGLLLLEKLGSYLWRLISPFAQKFFPINRSDKAFYAGLLWGWLPCGMVYSVLIWSFSSGSLLTGTVMMLAFGLGTLPMLLSLSLLGINSAPLLNHKAVAWVSGSLLISFSLWMLIMALTGQAQHQH